MVNKMCKLTMIIDDEGNTCTYVERGNTFHADSKGNSGAFAATCASAMINVSKKLGLIINNSTETKIVLNEKYFQSTWFRSFRINREKMEPTKTS